MPLSLILFNGMYNFFVQTNPSLLTVLNIVGSTLLSLGWVLFLIFCSSTASILFQCYFLIPTHSFCTLPEITEEALSAEIHEVGIKSDVEPFWKQWRCIFGFVAQTAYVYETFILLSSDLLIIICSGAQVGVASLAVNFIHEQGIGISESRASSLFSFCQLTFMFGR